jgi:hypothetical protein
MSTLKPITCLANLTKLTKASLTGGLVSSEYFFKADEVEELVTHLEAEQRPVVYQWVDSTRVAAFKSYIEHYHDAQDEALQEASQDHYERWLDTAELGDQYTVSENDHSLDLYEPSFEVVHVDEGENGSMYQLIFTNTAAALHFGLGWGKEADRA